MKTYRLLSLLGAALLAMGATAATKYEINVGGVEVTSDNASSVTGGDITFTSSSGYVSFNASTNTLTLKDVEISRGGSNDRAIHNRSRNNLKIQILGTCEFTGSGCSTLKFDRNTTLYVPSDATCKVKCTSSGDDAIYLTSDGIATTLTISGTGNIHLDSTKGEGIAGGKKETVVLSARYLYINANRGAFCDLYSVQFSPDTSNRSTYRGLTCSMSVELQPTGSSSYAHARNVSSITGGSNVTVKYPSFGSSVSLLSSSSYYNKEFIITDEVVASGYTTQGNYIYRNSTAIVGATTAILLAGPTLSYKYANPTSIEVPGYTNLNGTTYPVSIGAGAFRDMKNLQTARLNYGVCRIGDNAFIYDEWMTNIYIPSSVTEIGQYTFFHTNLSRVFWTTLDPSKASVSSVSFTTGGSGKISLNLPTKDASDKLPSSEAFTVFNKYVSSTCYDFKVGSALYVVSKRSTTGGSDGELALTGYDGSALAISSTNGAYTFRTQIGGYLCGNYYCTSVAPTAFLENTTVTSANLSYEKITSIGTRAFAKATSLQSVTIGIGTNYIAKDAFNQCTAIKSLTWNPITYSNFQYASDSPFVGLASQITSAALGSSVQHIPSFLFYNFSYVGSLTLPSSLKTIGAYACTNMGIKSVVFPNSVTTVDHHAFSNCSQLTSVTVGTGMTSIFSNAFESCEKITTVYWNAVSHNDFSSNSPFKDSASRITTFSFGNGVTRVPNFLCYNFSALKVVPLPSSLKTIGASAFYGSGLTSLYTNMVETICPEAFSHCTSLSSVSLGLALKLLDNGAFCYCSALTSISLPSQLASMGTYVFRRCTALATVNDYSVLTYIPDYTYQYCTALKQLKIRYGVTSVGKEALHHCDALTFVEIPKTVTSIGEMAFGCPNLARIDSYPRSEDVTLGSSVFYNVNKQTCQLHVRPSCLAKYKVADQWKDFYNKVGDLDDPGYNPYDVNGDGAVDVGDVNAVLEAILNNDKSAIYDVNGDGNVDVGDVNAILEYILSNG